MYSYKDCIEFVQCFREYFHFNGIPFMVMRLYTGSAFLRNIVDNSSNIWNLTLHLTQKYHSWEYTTGAQKHNAKKVILTTIFIVALFTLASIWKQSSAQEQSVILYDAMQPWWKTKSYNLLIYDRHGVYHVEWNESEGNGQKMIILICGILKDIVWE